MIFEVEANAWSLCEASPLTFSGVDVVVQFSLSRPQTLLDKPLRGWVMYKYFECIMLHFLISKHTSFTWALLSFKFEADKKRAKVSGCKTSREFQCELFSVSSLRKKIAKAMHR